MPAKRLPWFKLWPEAIEHEKVAQLGDGEFRTWVTALAKAADQPTRWRFASRRHAATITGRPLGHVNTLVNARLLDDMGADGVWIHDWEQWQERYPSDFDTPPSNTPRTLPEQSANGVSKAPATLHEDSAEESPEDSPEDSVKKRELRRENKEYVTPNGVVGQDEPSPGDDRVDEVYAHFKARVQPRSRLCPRKKIAARLKSFSADELREGIDHFADDPWWMEHNADQGAGWFFESDARAEQFLLLGPRKRSNVMPMNGRAAPRQGVRHA